MDNIENALILEESVNHMRGPYEACDFIFSDPSLSYTFTSLMAEKFGETLSKSWLFLQKDHTNKIYIPLEGEKCFDINRGNISGIQRKLSPEQYKMVLGMLAEIINQMNLNVYHKNGEQYELIRAQVNSNTHTR